MHTLTRKLLAVLTLVLPLTILSAGVASGAPQGTNRPFLSSGEAVVTVDLNAGLEISIEGTLNATHMGQTAWVAEVTSVDLGAVITVNYASTLTAANGDTLTTEAVGVIDGTALTFTGTETITGGSGRFAGATGHFVLTGGITELQDGGPGIITIPLNVSATGSISY
jgi:hypothetical protein